MTVKLNRFLHVGPENMFLIFDTVHISSRYRWNFNARTLWITASGWMCCFNEIIKAYIHVCAVSISATVIYYTWVFCLDIIKHSTGNIFSNRILLHMLVFSISSKHTNTVDLMHSSKRGLINQNYIQLIIPPNCLSCQYKYKLKSHS